MKPFADRATNADDISTATEIANGMFVNVRGIKI